MPNFSLMPNRATRFRASSVARFITEQEKKIIAYHEVGHALTAARQKKAQPVTKITIVPHTEGTLGYTLHLPEEEKFLMSREDILTEIRTLLAGRCAEELVFDTQTSGAANDIERATELARNLVARFGTWSGSRPSRMAIICAPVMVSFLKR